MFLVAIIPIIAVSSANLLINNKGYSELTYAQQKTIEDSVTSQFNNASQELLRISNTYASDETLIEAFKSGDPQEMAEVTEKLFKRLQTEHHFEIFEFGDVNGKVLFRAHNPSKYGDDKSEKPAIQSALNGEKIAGFSFGTSGLNIRAFLPIKSNGEIIGTLQTGIDDTFLQSIKNSFQGVSINLYNDKGEALITTETDNRESISGKELDAVLTGKTVTDEQNGFLHTYIPMLEPTQSETIGLIQLKQDISSINSLIDENKWITLTIMGLTLVLVVSISIFFSRTISSPLTRVADEMNQIANGNLQGTPIDYKGRDEIKQLADSINSMKDKLKETIQNVLSAAVDVSTHSNELTQSANEVRQGSEQIASTMQELSSGTEVQAANSTNLYTVMEDFTVRMQQINDNGNEIDNRSTEVLKMINAGSELMQRSVSQMHMIDQTVKESIRKVQSLEKQSQEISKLILVIKDIAEQTNLLSLNAAIEAARAKEHGSGFSVVADEVRKLAEKVSDSVQDITQIVTNVQAETGSMVETLTHGYNEVKEGTKQMEATGSNFTTMNDALNEMAEKIKKISNSLEDITKNSDKMKITIEEVTAVTEESAAGVEQTAASAQQSSSSMEEIARNANGLTELAENLTGQVRRFKL
ncbi:methyl-accepting chemotaxis protein [Sediminibacillus massiliensis]|uniref:methyl-accepting chemotaxis protein n=1 Tax=Sediminibacillus massiliensis TaxID=1926277 RepID=UPI001178934A|nr:methyl-accepting chemotaxis protein [Sediminibacillus massiliensis]